MVGTLFLTFCDVEIGKVLTGLLSKQTLDMTEMRAQVQKSGGFTMVQGTQGHCKTGRWCWNHGYKSEWAGSIRGTHITLTTAGANAFIVDGEGTDMQKQE